jgi:hypothetical protein
MMVIKYLIIIYIKPIKKYRRCG